MIDVSLVTNSLSFLVRHILFSGVRKPKNHQRMSNGCKIKKLLRMMLFWGLFSYFVICGIFTFDCLIHNNNNNSNNNNNNNNNNDDDDDDDNNNNNNLRIAL